MSRKLTKANVPRQTSNRALTSDQRASVLFKLALTDTLLSPYTFKTAGIEGVRGFSLFLTKTVGRQLTISQVEREFLRTGGPHGAKNDENIHGELRTMLHFNNGSRSFRIHGYYNTDGYFCVCRLDPKHQYQY